MTDLPGQIAGLNTPVATKAGTRPYINFDNAASTPPFKAVMRAVNDFVPWYASVHRGNGAKSRISTDKYEEARAAVGAFFGANPQGHTVIFGKNTTEAINKLARRLPLSKKDIVIISHLEHHSNDLPWRQQATVKRIRMAPDGGIDRAHYETLLKKYAGRVKLVAVTGGSNVTGHAPDIYWFARLAHQAGARIFVDCAQLAARRPVSMGRADDPSHLDYIAVSAHKMYAPFGTGALIGRRDTFIEGEPDYSGGGTVSIVTTATVDWGLLPDKEEAGTPNVIGAVAFASALQNITAIGLGEIARHEKDLTQYALAQLKKVPGVRLYGARGDRLGVIPFTVSGVPPHLVSAVLGHEWGIGVRSGCFCAQPYVMSLLGVGRGQQQQIRSQAFHGMRANLPGMVRVSFGLYNTRAEVDLFVHAVQEIAQGHHGAYKQEPLTGFYTPAQ